MKNAWMLLFALLFAASSVLAGTGPQPAKKTTHKYGGVKTCKTCHMSAKSGAQYKVWKKSAHAKAYETLKTPEAIAVGKKHGVDSPVTSDKCLKCHVTAFGVDAALKGPKLTMEEGVSCEACHGAGSGYKKKKIMKAITAGKANAADYGLIVPDEKVCVKCHNEESPSYKEFDFKAYSAKIAHPLPKK